VTSVRLLADARFDGPDYSYAQVRCISPKWPIFYVPFRTNADTWFKGATWEVGLTLSPTCARKFVCRKLPTLTQAGKRFSRARRSKLLP
jgi:hypothetical protein